MSDSREAAEAREDAHGMLGGICRGGDSGGHCILCDNLADLRLRHARELAEPPPGRHITKTTTITNTPTSSSP